MLRPIFPQHRGAALPLVAISLVVPLGMASLAVDGGRLYETRRQLQNAVDGAAMAGGWELMVDLSDPVSATLKAFEYAQANGVTLPELVEISVYPVCNESIPPGSNPCVRVTAQRTVPLILAGVLGMKQAPVRATATAIVTSQVAGGLAPFGVSVVDVGGPAPLKAGAKESEEGNFRILDFPLSAGAKDVYDYILNGWPGPVPTPICVKDNDGVLPCDGYGPPLYDWWVTSEPGNIARVKSAIDQLIAQDQCVNLEPEQAAAVGKMSYRDVRCPLTIIVPIIAEEWKDLPGGKTDVHVIRFSAYRITGYYCEPSNSPPCAKSGPPGMLNIKGNWLDWTVGPTGQKSLPGAELSGTLTVRLWR